MPPKKHIKVKFLGTYYQGEAYKRHNLYPILNEHFDLEVCDDPDFVIATSLDKPFNWCNYDCVRVLFTGENYSPDFNIFDYAVTSDDIHFGDRFYRYQQFNDKGWAVAASKKHIDVPDDLLSQKQYFCDFIYKNGNGQPGREAMFHKLNAYKRVESGGTWLNNMPGGRVIGWPDEKQEFQKLCKFTIAIDSIQYPGFITEKITNAFMNRTIPIYLGAPDVETIFNPKAFINCANFETLDDVVEYVKFLDNNDEAYMAMMREPAFLDPDFAQKTYDGLVEWALHVFSQDPSEAIRRYPTSFSQKAHLEQLQCVQKYYDILENRPIPRIKRFARKCLSGNIYEKIKKFLKK